MSNLVCLCSAPASILAARRPEGCEVLNDRDGSLVLLLRHWRWHKAALIAEIAASDPDAAPHRDSELGNVLSYYFAQVNPAYPGASPEEKLEALSRRLRRVYVENHPPLELLRFFDSSETLFYVDAPHCSAERMFLDLALSHAQGRSVSPFDNTTIFPFNETTFPVSGRKIKAA